MVERLKLKSAVPVAAGDDANGNLQHESIRGLLDCKDLERVLKVSPRKIWQLYSSGQIPHVRLGRAVRFRPEDVEAFICGGGA